MDIDAIGPYNPNNINWRALTAREIIKYDNQGVEVPDIYLQWAIEFLNNIDKYDNDDITYEKSFYTEPQNENIPQSPATEETAAPSEIEQQASGSAPDKTPVTENNLTDNSNPEQSLNDAQKKRQEMQNNGVTLRNQAITFTSDSLQSSQSAEIAQSLLPPVQTNSENDIQALENSMEMLMSEINAKQNEFKNAAAEINNNGNNRSALARIEQLQRELEQLGVSGQSEASQTQTSLDGYNIEINAETTAFDGASDTGSETVDIGNELSSLAQNTLYLDSETDLRIGSDAINSGNNSINSANNGFSVQAGVQNINSQNISRINSLENEIEQNTGVPPVERTDNEKNNEPVKDLEADKDPITGKVKNSDKDIKISQNDGTDTTDKLNISLDEIVKRKVRRGEYSKES